MIRNQIVIKLGATIIFLFLIVLVPVGFVIERIFSGFYYSEVREENDKLSTHYTQVIAANNNYPEMVSMIEMMANFSNVNLYIIDRNGQVIAKTGVPYIEKGTYVPDQELRLLIAGKPIEKEYADPLLQKRYLVSGKPLFFANDFSGGVYVVAPVEQIDQSLQKVRAMLLLSGAGAFFLALGFTYVFSKQLSNPLIQMEKATRKIAKGDLNIRIEHPTKDEIGSLAQAINDLAFDLEKYRNSQREFFANISHELRTPMTYLEGYAKIIKDKLYQTEEEKEQYLNIIYEETIRLTRIVDDLFDLSKMEEGKISLTLEWVDVVEVMERAIYKTIWKAKEKGLELAYHYQEKIPLVYCDGHRMEQIFLNLIDNAIRYTEQGMISIDMDQKGGDLKIRIEDTGIGIPESELPYVFDRFFRVEKSRSRQHGGSGLGLAIVKNLVEIQKGSIEIASNAGKGTCIELTFPFEPDKVGKETEQWGD